MAGQPAATFLTMAEIYYRIDNSGEVGVFVPGHGHKALWETQTEAIEGARVISEHPDHAWRSPVYVIHQLDTSKGKDLGSIEVSFTKTI